MKLRWKVCDTNRVAGNFLSINLCKMGTTLEQEVTERVTAFVTG
jgi:hypothetical protein